MTASESAANGPRKRGNAVILGRVEAVGGEVLEEVRGAGISCSSGRRSYRGACGAAKVEGGRQRVWTRAGGGIDAAGRWWRKSHLIASDEGAEVGMRRGRAVGKEWMRPGVGDAHKARGPGGVAP